jgi:hypothetical protein
MPFVLTDLGQRRIVDVRTSQPNASAACSWFATPY